MVDDGCRVTVPPQKAERLSPDARSFTNEFVPDREHAVARAGEPPPVPGEEPTRLRTRQDQVA